MAKIKLAAIKSTLVSELNSARDLRNAVQTATARNTRGGLPKTYVDQAIGLAFVGMVDAWETYVEGTLIRYFAGAASRLAHPPTIHPYLAPKGLAQARDLLYKLNREPKFLAVGYYSDIKSISDFVIAANNPYSTLAPRATEIENGKCIRNRVAHSGLHANDAFKKVARKHLGLLTNAPLPKGYSPGRLLVSPASRSLFPNMGQAQVNTVFDEFLTLYRDLADKIVP